MSSRNLEINRGDNTCVITLRKGENATKEVKKKQVKLYALWKTSPTSEVKHTQGKNLENSDKCKRGKTSSPVPSYQHF